MGRPSQKKHDKRRRRARARRKQDARRHQAQLELRDRARYPHVVIVDDEEAPPGLAQLVREGLERLDLRDPRRFSQPERQFFQRMRRVGFFRALDEVQRGEDFTPEQWAHVQSVFFSNVGIRLFELLDEQALRSFLPYTNVQVIPVGEHFAVGFQSLASQPSKGGRIYASRYRPRLQIDGEERTVGWSSHAIERTCERVAPYWHSYAGLADAFAFFDQCLYYEPCRLTDGTPAFTFYDSCHPDLFGANYVTEVLGQPRPAPDTRLHYRVGYCPVVAERGHWVAKTILFPGYRNTPELALLRRARLHPLRRQALFDKIEALGPRTLHVEGDFSLLRWFHENGVPQVREFDQQLYAKVPLPCLKGPSVGRCA